MQNKEPIYAGFFVRMAAFIIDNIIVWCGLLLIRIPFGIMSLSSPENFLVKDFIFQYSVIDIVLYLAGCAYFILMTYYSGSTVGKRLMHIKVISCEDRKLTFFEVAFRETIGRFLASIIVDAGYIMVGVDKDKRGFHDILADTRVVYEHPKPQYVTPVQPRPMPRPVYHPGTGMVQPGGGMPGNGQLNMSGNGMPGNGSMNMPGNGMSGNGATNMLENGMSGNGSMNMLENGMSGNGSMNMPGNGMPGNGATNMLENGMSGNGSMNMPGNGMSENVSGNSIPGSGTMHMPGNSVPPLHQDAAPYEDTFGYRDTLTRDVQTPDTEEYQGETRMSNSLDSQWEIETPDTHGSL